MTVTGSPTGYDSRNLGFAPDRDRDAHNRAERLIKLIDVLRPFADAIEAPLEPENYRPHAERLARDFTLPDWPQGRINLVEAAVLDIFVRGLRPSVVVEVGVASGVSSAALLSAIATLEPMDTPRLRSYDIMTHCYFDESRPVGEAAREMVPGLIHHQQLKRGGARTSSADLPASSVSLAFIDANHGHPAPVADLIDLAPCLAPGAWVVLHDIRLSRAMLERDPQSERAVYGAEVLFDHWSGAKVCGETFASNIGAIRVDHPDQLTPEHLAAIIDEPWESIADSPHVRQTLHRDSASAP